MHRSTGIGVSRWLGGLLGVALALPALALPQGCIELLAQAPRVDVVQGQQRDLRLAVPIERLAIGDPKIADVQLLDRRGFLVTGKEQGSTSLLIWTGCSPSRCAAWWRSRDAVASIPAVLQRSPPAPRRSYRTRCRPISASSRSAAAS